MSEFMVSLLSLCLVPFSETSNLLIIVPTVCLVISFCFALISRLMRGGRVR